MYKLSDVRRTSSLKHNKDGCKKSHDRAFMGYLQMSLLPTYQVIGKLTQIGSCTPMIILKLKGSVRTFGEGLDWVSVEKLTLEPVRRLVSSTRSIWFGKRYLQQSVEEKKRETSIKREVDIKEDGLMYSGNRWTFCGKVKGPEGGSRERRSLGKDPFYLIETEERWVPEGTRGIMVIVKLRE